MSFRWSALALALVSLLACSKSSTPSVSCTPATCPDLSHHYCDVDGTIGGIPGACVAVSCQPGTFRECRDANTALICDGSGDTYDLSTCPNGCSAVVGCRTCMPDQSICENSELTVCDGSGDVIAMQSCTLGCDTGSGTRCLAIAPSNGLATYVDMVPAPADLDLGSGTWTIDTSTGTFVGTGGATLSPTTFLAPAQGGGPPIRVVVVAGLVLGDVAISGDPGQSTAIAFLATGSVEVTGIVTVASGAGDATSGACTGASGAAGSADGFEVDTNGGGGGGATAGGSGGIATGAPDAIASAGGVAAGSASIEPLLGGCAGGGFAPTQELGALGGGAIQISTPVSITVTGTIAVDGAAATTTRGGGGGGGGILLEAAVVTVDAHAALSALGGDGGGCSPATTYCGAPGAGGTATVAPGAGGDVTFDDAAPAGTDFAPGAGGGSVGRVRINTRSGDYTLVSGAIEHAVVTTGVLQTR